jgi:hypothetical protein
MRFAARSENTSDYRVAALTLPTGQRLLDRLWGKQILQRFGCLRKFESEKTNKRIS